MPKAVPKQAAHSDPKRRTSILVVQSLLLVLAIGIYLYLTAQTYVIRCEKETSGWINCSLRDTFLGVLTLKERQLPDFGAAAVGEECVGDDCRYRIEMYDNQGSSVPVREEYTPGNSVKQRLVNLLNSFVINPDKRSITLQEQLDWIVFMLPLFAIGAFVLYRLNLKTSKS